MTRTMKIGTLKVGCHNYIQVDQWSMEDIIIRPKEKHTVLKMGTQQWKKGQDKGERALYLARQKQTNTTKSRGKLVEIQRSALHWSTE